MKKILFIITLFYTVYSWLCSKEFGTCDLLDGNDYFYNELLDDWPFPTCIYGSNSTTKKCSDGWYCEKNNLCMPIKRTLWEYGFLEFLPVDDRQYDRYISMVLYSMNIDDYMILKIINDYNASSFGDNDKIYLYPKKLSVTRKQENGDSIETIYRNYQIYNLRTKRSFESYMEKDNDSL